MLVQREATPLQGKAAKAAIEFPTAGATGGLSQVKVTAYPTSHNDAKGCSYSNRLPEIKEILGHARDGEDLATVRTDVVISFSDPDFDGRSYGLALALADKRARFGEQGPFERIIATGVLNKPGLVSRVEAFPQKLALVLATPDQRSLFVFPRENLDDDPDLLERTMVGKGMLRAVSHLNELHDLWQAERMPSHHSEVPALPDSHELLQETSERMPSHHSEVPVRAKSYFFRGMLLGFSIVLLMTGISILLFRSLASS
ncbi:MAG: hypothetical protein V9H25_02100 [Candidatus Competibacter sp.]